MLLTEPSMTTDPFSDPQATDSTADSSTDGSSLKSESPSSLWQKIVVVLTPLASLKLTVALFLASIFIVFAGTLAQTEKDIWQVIHDYFRMDLQSPKAAMDSAFAWIDFRIFFPRSFFPEMKPIPWGYGFLFPSGWLIGFVMFLNLSAAHLIRFRIQAKRTRLVAGLITLAIGVAVTAAVIAVGSDQTGRQPQLFSDWPELRILWLLAQCTAASLLLLFGCMLIFRKRAGIVLLHSGIGLLMLGELLVGIAAVEGQMQIVEGHTVNYVMDSREIELAIIDRSDKTEDSVVAVPQSLLRPGKAPIQVESLPFEVEAVKYYANSTIRAATRKDNNPATAGIGLQQIAIPMTPVSGTDRTGKANSPTVYVRLVEKATKEPLGVYMFSLRPWLQGRYEPIQVGGKKYDVALRYKHDYKPYSMHLIDVEHDVYLGTQTAKSYASELRLVDPDRKVDRTVRIWMNNPLRFGGETFYQSSYGRDPATGNEYTGLQVVTNTGWRIPYVSCMMVAVGMLAQFWVSLRRYMKRRLDGRITPAVDATDQKPGRVQQTPPGRKGGRKGQGSSPALQGTGSRTNWVFPTVIVLLCGGWMASKAVQRPASPKDPDIVAFGRLPVMYEGRIKPFDTLARNSLRIISDKQTFTDSNNKRQPAIRWLLDAITDTESARKHRVFRIHNLDVLDTLGLERRKGFRYSIDEFAPNLEAFEKQVRKTRMIEPAERDLYSKKIIEFDGKLRLYMLLREAFRLPSLQVESFSEDMSREASRREEYARYSLPLAVPPQDDKDETWTAYTHAVFDALAQRLAAAQGMKTADPNPATIALVGILGSYESDGQNAAGFNREVSAYWSQLTSNPPIEWNPKRTNFETFFNHFSPLYYAMILYIIAFLLGCFSWLGWTLPLKRASTWLCIFTLVVHTLALVGRMYISGRPPITNLYSSALFVGWACVVIALLFEWYSKIGVANVVAAFSGFGALLIAFLLTTAVPSFKGDSFTVLVAVLDTQFWLATHVTCVTAGYSATFVAGLLGIVYVVRGVLTPSLTPAMAKEVSRMIYGTVCFAIFFSFFGTVLGGLWADDSWGRFWGWDPKENGALIIVIWNAVVLHSYWGRLVRQRGLAVLVIVGNIVTAWSWFGVNELGVGLHSYGFTDGVLKTLSIVVAAHLLIVLTGLLPRRIWRSSAA
jgi:ABC-type transport system involved in cytochrome c biogenesis permease subunit